MPSLSKILRKPINEKPPMLANRETFLLHDNVTVHKVTKIQPVVQDSSFVEVHHPFYIPHLTPSNVYLFRLLNKHLRECRFKSDDCLKEAVYHVFDDQEETFFFKGIKSLESKWCKWVIILKNKIIHKIVFCFIVRQIIYLVALVHI